MSILKKLLLSLALLAFYMPLAFAADPWPADATGTELSTEMMSLYPDFETSGIVQHRSGDYFVVDDGGSLIRLTEEGLVVEMWTLGGDLEAIAQVDGDSDNFYIADEARNAIVEWSLTLEDFTGKVWTLDLPRSGGSGFEALASIPSSQALASWPSGSFLYFAAASQANTRVYFYALDPSLSDSVTAFASFTTPYYDISAMDFHVETKQLYVLFDSDNKMKEYSLEGVQNKSYTLPTRVGEEGLTLTLSCASASASILLADDVSGSIVRYENYPIDCDEDGDGYFASEDCDDARAFVHAVVRSYPDRDRDTLGDPSGAVDACFRPLRYVLNADDTNDSIPNFGVEIYGDGRDNDGDGLVDEVNTLAENGAHPYYSTFDASTKAWRSIILSTAQVELGSLDVTFSDNSVYRYPVFPGSEISTWELRRGQSFAYATSLALGKSKKLNMLTGL